MKHAKTVLVKPSDEVERRAGVSASQRNVGARDVRLNRSNIFGSHALHLNCNV
jgi:hypothetical protein